jgi:transcriptional regulator with XRE-family HTH domain
MKELRETAGLSQWELAVRTNGAVSQSTVSVIERGYRKPAPKQLAAIAKVLAVAPEDITEGK